MKTKKLTCVSVRCEIFRFRLLLIIPMMILFSSCSENDDIVKNDETEQTKETMEENSPEIEQVFRLTDYDLFIDDGEINFEFVYDEEGGVASIDYIHFGNNGSYSFEYESGKLRKVQNASSRMDFEYDTHGFLTGISEFEKQEGEVLNALIKYGLSYNEKGQLIKVQKYSTDENGELTVVNGYMLYEYDDETKNPKKEISYKQDGTEKSVTLYEYEVFENPFVPMGISVFMALYSGDGPFGVNDIELKSISYSSSLESFETTFKNDLDENGMLKEVTASSNGSYSWNAVYSWMEIQ